MNNTTVLSYLRKQGGTMSSSLYQEDRRILLWAEENKVNRKLPCYLFPVPDPQAWAIDSMSIRWTNKFVYAYPPTKLILYSSQVAGGRQNKDDSSCPLFGQGCHCSEAIQSLCGSSKDPSILDRSAKTASHVSIPLLPSVLALAKAQSGGLTLKNQLRYLASLDGSFSKIGVWRRTNVLSLDTNSLGSRIPHIFEGR